MPFSRMTGKIIQVRRPGLPGRVAGMGWTTAATEAPSSTAQTWTRCGAIQVEGVPVASTWTDAPISGGLTWTDSRQSAVRRTSAGRWSLPPGPGPVGIEIAPASVLTSARRWLECGVWRTTLVNKAFIAAYLLGVRPARIARWRLMGKQQHFEPSALSSDRSRRALPR